MLLSLSVSVPERGNGDRIKRMLSPLCFRRRRLPKIKEWIDANDPGGVLIPLSGVLETRLSDLPDDERQSFLDQNKITR